MKATLPVLLLAVWLAAGCAQHYVASSINGVSYRVSRDRGPVSGARHQDMGLRIMMDQMRGEQGTLWVDGTCFGTVLVGDQVEVTDDAVVLVNDVVRQPVGR